jgi:DNA-binding NtrC family response regulator
MFGVKERQSVDQSTNFLNKPHEIGLFSRIHSILIADEDRDVLSQLSQSFAICAKQYNIYTAQNGRDALKVLGNSSVDILLTALNIPVMHDFELIDYTKHYYPATRIFVMSAEDPSAMKNRLDDLRIYGYIKKPIRIEMVYSVLRA